MPSPVVTVVISNKNGVQWLPKCLESVRAQTIADKIEIIFVDNVSADDSVPLARKLLDGFPQATIIENKKDLGFTGGMNTGALAAKGDSVFLLSNDTWLEEDCLEQLVRVTTEHNAAAAMPLVMNYADDSIQTIGCDGIDLFGLGSITWPPDAKIRRETTDIFLVAGCGYWARTDVFKKVGGFDEGQFMFAEEVDLSWRIWIAGGKLLRTPAARMHHRGAAGVNPAGETKIVESRTSETKRYLANRNGILVLLKNAQHILLVLLIPQLLLLFAEALVSLLLIRRWGYVRKSYFKAISDAFRMLPHVRDWRRRIEGFRKRNDFAMLRYLRLKPNRWEDFMKLFKLGVPKVDAK
jgi:GT2 family glycosyltransferase